MNQYFTVQKKSNICLKKKFVQRGSPKNSCTSSERKCKLKIPRPTPPPHHFSNGPSLKLPTVARQDKTLARIQNTSLDPKTRPRIRRFWDVFRSVGSVFGFCDVFWILAGAGSRFWPCFWILGCVLDSGKCFWILGSGSSQYEPP